MGKIKRTQLKEIAITLDAIVYVSNFIVANRDKFEEHDPDGVKKRTIDQLRKYLNKLDKKLNSVEITVNEN